ncbi:MAG: M48 family metalloprotease, partial [Alphaproteobacteria bacterium]
GLLRRAQGPDEVIGVLAHEIGHIAGGHLARLNSELESASTQALLAAILGVAAGVAAGRADVGAAVAVGGQSSAVRGLLAHTRVQESAADQAAFRFLEATNRSAQGLVDLLGRLSDQELVSSRYQDPYVRTHPLSRDRLETAKIAVAQEGPTAQKASAEDRRRFARMQAKLAGFTDPPAATLDRYTGDDVDSRYARAIAH